MPFQVEFEGDDDKNGELLLQYNNIVSASLCKVPTLYFNIPIRYCLDFRL